jgi:hypothetical protein
MPAIFNEIGVKTVSAALCESVEVTKQVEHKVIKANDGGFAQGHRFDPNFSFSVKGRGSVAASVIGGTGGSYLPDVISGGTTIITSVKNSETNEDPSADGAGYGGD